MGGRRRVVDSLCVVITRQQCSSDKWLGSTMQCTVYPILCSVQERNSIPANEGGSCRKVPVRRGSSSIRTELYLSLSYHLPPSPPLPIATQVGVHRSVILFQFVILSRAATYIRAGGLQLVLCFPWNAK